MQELGEVVKEFPYEATTQDTAALSGCSLGKELPADFLRHLNDEN